MNKLLPFATISFIYLALQSASSQPLLSRLHATKGAPVYTTYAAAKERSEFIIDEGYQLIWTDPSRPLLFGSEHGGFLSFATKLNGQIHYNLGQYSSAPVISTSYSDLVRFTCNPFPALRMDAFYLVQSSRRAICDVALTNESEAAVSVSLYPLFQLPADSLRIVQTTTEKDALVFRHRESPDGWVIDHQIPFVPDRLNAFVLDTAFTAFGAYTSIGQASAPRLARAGGNWCVEWGQVHHADGTPCLHPPGLASQVVYLNKAPEQILTETAPKWGDSHPNIPGNGYQGCELGNFSAPAIAPGDSFIVTFSCLVTRQQGTGRGVVPDLPATSGVRVDLLLNSTEFLSPANQVTALFSPDNRNATISWPDEPGRAHDLFRRGAASVGRFVRVSAGLATAPYLDMNLSPDSTYAYVLLDHDSSGRRSTHSAEVGNITPSATTFLEDAGQEKLSGHIPSIGIYVLAMQRDLIIPPHETRRLRLVRGLSEAAMPSPALLGDCRALQSEPLDPYLAADETDYSKIPSLASADSDVTMLYWNAFTLLRQCMLPPEGQLSHNYYVFSREPQWGWGHGGQVFHESLSMLAYVFMDPTGAMNSQRVFMERQAENGYINYRTGPYLDETIPYNGELTSSAPWFSWEDFEIYKITKDQTFLEEAYQAGTEFYNFWIAERDKNHNGLCEWGGHAVLESVRDGLTVVWDQVGWPSNFEAMDLNCMLVSEAEALAGMARELGDTVAQQSWEAKAAARSALINNSMWDPGTGFYYHTDMTGKGFTFQATNDLKRKELIGFLPLWAGVANAEQAMRLVQHMNNASEFWRLNGIPSLSADDPSYNPAGYWNGPVWVQWQYLIFRGLLRYGYVDEARALAAKVTAAMIRELRASHWFWELYSPDAQWAGWNKTYIWAGIVARMLLDVQQLPTEVKVLQDEKPMAFRLEQNYPNPCNPSTIIEYTIAEASQVKLVVYDIVGREVATLVNEVKPAGKYRVTWNASGLASGVYLYRLRSGAFVETKSMVVVR